MKRNSNQLLLLLAMLLIGISSLKAQVSAVSDSNNPKPVIERTHRNAQKVYTFTIDEEIAKPASLRVEKAMEEAKREKADLIVVKINTFGGALDAADEIRTKFLQSPIPIYAFIDNNAASAGALISIACDSIYMHSGSSIGAATVVDQMGAVQPDKYQSYMRSLMRTTAESRGRRPDIAQAMVDPDIYVAGISDSGKVLTFTTQEAIENHYCEAQCESIAEVLSHAGVDKYTLVEQHYTFIEKIVGWLVNPVVSGILIMLIIGGIYFELQAPGLGLPTIVALTGALLYFAPLYLEGLAANWEILLFVIGLVLIALELFVVPGFGVCGIAGITCTVFGLAFSLIGNVGFDFSHVPSFTIGESFLIVLLSLLIALPLSMWICKKLFESNMFGGLALNTVQNANDGFTIATEEETNLIGAEGEAETILRPAGKVRIDGRVYDAIASISYIDKGEPIKVVGYENASIMVTKR